MGKRPPIRHWEVSLITDLETFSDTVQTLPNPKKGMRNGTMRNGTMKNGPMMRSSSAADLAAGSVTTKPKRSSSSTLLAARLSHGSTQSLCKLLILTEVAARFYFGSFS